MYQLQGAQVDLAQSAITVNNASAVYVYNATSADTTLTVAAGTGGSNYVGSITIKTKTSMVIRKDPGNTSVAGAGTLKATPRAFHW